MTILPIDTILPQLKETLQVHSAIVLVAPPGAGKTTRVPLALLDVPLFAKQRILMLEPRRLAARTAARYMAASLNQQVGETVGYRVRMDTRVGPSTRIEVITEGVLTRMLQQDPSLEGVGAVIFDEFHERSLHADLGLALCLQAQALLRDDLRIIVMSATLDAQAVAGLMNDAPILISEGRSFEVATHYLDRKPDGRIEQTVVRVIVQALEQHEYGNMLVFVPGTGEIRRIEARLRELQLGPLVQITPLHGSLPQESQDRAISRGQANERKIVLTTSIAESSLTVDGIGIVIDSGLSRVPRFSPRTGMTRLETVPVSLASADQRRGRAGRLGPGTCYRLWTEADHRQLLPLSKPEIAEADLAPLALELAAWGVTEPAELTWLDSPPRAAFVQARSLLVQLGAMNPDGSITSEGRRMAGLGLHPRLAHMLLKAIPLGYGELACELAALLNERDFLKGDSAAPNADLRLRVEALRRAMKSKDYSSGALFYEGFTVDAAACKRIWMEAGQWKRELRIQVASQPEDVHHCGLLLAFAFPDRIGQRRSQGGFLLSSGRGAQFIHMQPLANSPYNVTVELDDQGTDSRIYLAAPVEWEELEQHFSESIERDTITVWDPTVQAVRSRHYIRMGAILIKDVPNHTPDQDDVYRALVSGIVKEGLALLPWTKASLQLRERLQFMNHYDTDWPDMADPALIINIQDWLAPHLHGLKSRSDLQRLNMFSILESMLSWEQRRALDESAPTHITVPSGSRISVDYSDPDIPTLSVRLQELFGLEQTPRIGGGRVPIRLQLLSPAQRPVQVTSDLASFWRHTYFEVKKDLKGRYPKHYWPDDPLVAMPTSRVRPKNLQ
ncbi:ATP-dependent helicase HrpB [Paenibacillus sp. FSL H7-0331]|uniref:ATP-dependent helicase HrpB n=1 Tax=Paenibacillus sp. FSL H7-0331 TaxID=1920421 RepID=UPI00096C5FD9|nr:ATP-dependent helicase HrpB [Paenibacillus sp. FSL H7-0331]OMF03914.1 ATP-dependent helicase HrpB [Paenibacillus sp. FSL H7-0331]